MKFSIIMPSLLADFPGAATGRDKKLIRSIYSCLNQTFSDFELIIIADGCQLTKYLVEKQFIDLRIKLLFVERKQLFSNTPRNTGIDNAKGEYIIYLDNDDRFGVNHLQIVNDNLNGEDWVYFKDNIYTRIDYLWATRDVDVTQYGKCGTSNICHASRLNLRWIEAGYGHDYMFIQQLLKFPNHKQISPAEYFVCHIGNLYCV